VRVAGAILPLLWIFFVAETARAGCLQYEDYLHQEGIATLPGNTMSAAYAGSYAYVANHEYGLRVIDISDPQNPVIVKESPRLGS
jgi:hypothetical protein